MFLDSEIENRQPGDGGDGQECSTRVAVALLRSAGTEKKGSRQEGEPF